MSDTDLMLSLDRARLALETGTAEEQARARAEFQRQERVAAAMRSGATEIPRGALRFERNGRVVDERSGTLYVLYRGDTVDPTFQVLPAYYVSASGDVGWLEHPAGGPQTVDELEAKRAEREARRNAPKPRPAWMSGVRQPDPPKAFWRR